MIQIRKIGNLRELTPTPAPASSGPRHFEVVAVMGAGLVTAAVLVLHGKGYNAEAYTLGASGAILGATFAALKLLSTR